MESSSFKRPKLELQETKVEKNNSMLCEDSVEHMDIVDNGVVSQLCEKEPEVDKTPILDGQVAQKSCDSKEIYMDKLFERYYMVTDKKPKNVLVGRAFVPSQFHHWGTLSNIKNKSYTLRELTKNVNLDNMRNCEETFVKILKELDYDYSIVKLDSLKPEEVKHIIAFDIKSIPMYTFCGYGSTKGEAANVAAKNGLKFFVASCQ